TAWTGSLSVPAARVIVPWRRHDAGYASDRNSVITSAANPRLTLLRALASRRQRDKLGLFVCEGEDLVTAGLDAGLVPVEAFIDAERPPLGGGAPRGRGVSSGVGAEVSE